MTSTENEMTKAFKNQIIGSALLMAGALGLLAVGRMAELASAPAPEAPQPPAVVVAASTPEAEPEAAPETDALGDWAARAHDAEQAHQDRCWDQLEERGYGDASCY